MIQRASLSFHATDRNNTTVAVHPECPLSDFAKRRIMSQTIVVNVPHKLGKAEARRRIQEGFGAMQQLDVRGLPGVLSFEKRWDGDQFHFEAGGLGQKISAMLEILDDSVNINIEVPNLLAALAEFIKAAVTKETVKALEHSGGG